LIAEAYSARPDDYSILATASLLELLGLVVRLRILDLACGHGMVVRKLAKDGADIVGVDISPRLLETAPGLGASERPGISCVEADATAPGLLEEEVFDAAACNFGLGDTDHLYGALANVGRLLRPGGRFVFCILHPCSPGAGRVSASWPTGGTYHGGAWWLSADELSRIRYKAGATHRAVSSYLKALVDSGLVVDRVAEPPADRDWADERSGTAGAPVYLVARALRPPSPAV
jgi:SAM-dependent methyltransferase